jgi:Raf kinase inhibitor-like YbhB/YbcL family protein
VPLLLCLAALVVVAVMSVGCGGGGGGENATRPLPEAPARMDITSTAFEEGETIPTKFTCDGDGDSPQLAWSGTPTDAKELVLTVDDAKAGHYVHWTVLGIPPTVTGVSEDEEPEGGTDAKNSAGDDGWTGPCPPEGDGVHDYEFAIYALDAPLGLGEDATHDELRAALEDHALARGVLVGRFGRG